MQCGFAYRNGFFFSFLSNYVIDFSTEKEKEEKVEFKVNGLIMVAHINPFLFFLCRNESHELDLTNPDGKIFFIYLMF